jgi:hypothetical protein
MKFAALQTEYRSGKTPMSFYSWGSFSMNDTSAFAGVYFKGGADDITKDPQLQQFLQTADTSIDPAVRKANYTKAQELISKQAYVAPMFSYSTFYAFNAQLKFQGYRTSCRASTKLPGNKTGLAHILRAPLLTSSAQPLQGRIAMLIYLLRRLAIALCVALTVSVVSFTLLHLSGDLAVSIAGRKPRRPRSNRCVPSSAWTVR